MHTQPRARAPRASATPRQSTVRPLAAGRERLPVGVLRVALGSLFSVALVVAAATAAGHLVPAADPTHVANPPTGALVVVLEAAARGSDAARPLDGPEAPSTASRRVSPLLELAFGARRRRRHLPLGAAFDAVVAIAAAGAALVGVALAACKIGCWCGTCSPSAAGWLATACECA